MNNFNTKKSNEIIDNVANFINKLKFDELNNYALTLIDKYPKWDFSYSALAISLKEKGNYDSARKYFSKAVSINSSSNNYNNLGCLYRDIGDFKEAEKIFLNIINSDINFYQAYNNLALLYFDNGDYKNSEFFFHNTLKIEKTFFPALMGLGNINRENNNFSESLLFYNKALKINPNFHTLYNERAILYSKKNDYLNALDDISKSISLNQSDPLSYSIRATIHLRENKPNQAISDFKNCLSLKNNYKGANHGIGLAYKSRGQISEAISFFKKEIILYPDDHESLFMIGDSYIMIGDFVKSIIYLEKALSLDPENSDYNTILAVQKKISGEYDIAAKLFKKGALEGWRENELSCLYMLNSDLESFYLKLDEYSQVSENSPLISSIYSHANYNFNYPNTYNFCQNPMDFIYKKNLNQIVDYDDKFIETLISDISKLDSDHVGQLLLINGEQSAGNIFKDSVNSFQMLNSIIIDQLSDYKTEYSQNNNNFINNWPKVSQLVGWCIRMKKGGHLNRHMHEDSWVSGTLYLNMPKGADNKEGMIEFSLFNEQYPMNPKIELKTKILNISRGDIVLFPSSLFHQTIPFNTDDERLCIAFDLKPL